MAYYANDWLSFTFKNKYYYARGLTHEERKYIIDNLSWSVVELNMSMGLCDAIGNKQRGCVIISEIPTFTKLNP